jgi:cytosine/adenosine deaminase-related metal-dependent hydrolase
MSSDQGHADARNLKARYVFPISGEPIPDGVVTISADRIQSVGRNAAESPVEDLGNVAIIPGLVNAHIHLEFSHLSEPLGDPGIGITEWIGRVIESRFGSVEDPALAVEQGIRESIRSGVTSLAEIAQPDWPARSFDGRGLDATVFLELIGPTADRALAAVDLARGHLEAAASTGSWRAGLGPHAPYSVHPRLLSAAVSLSIARRVPLSFHLAESREEMELLRFGSGPFRELLERFGAWDADSFSPGTRPLDYLRTLGPAHRSLIVHGNYLDDEELSYLGDHADRMAVVYCPRTHAFFAHDDYPLARLLAAGAAVALGTDSRASSPDLSILAEMQEVARQHPSVSPATVLRLGTLEGAKALGLGGQTGSLEPGKCADLAIVSLPDQTAADPHELLFDDESRVVSRYWHGRPSKHDVL